MVFDFAIFTIYTFLHVYNGLNISCLYLHNNGYTCVPADLFELVNNSPFCQVLHVYINGGDDVAAIDRWRVGNIQVFIQHFSPADDTRCAS